MNNIHKEILVWIQLGFFVLIWVGVLFISGSELRIGWEAIKKLPDVVTIYILIVLLFIKWAWRWPIFKNWLVRLPDLQGTWKGTIESTWVDPDTGQKITTKDTTLVIKQSFSSISCVMYTDESYSHSVAAQIYEDNKNGIFFLTYNYINRPQVSVRDRSVTHDGAVILKVILRPEKRLEGEYWTNRKTTGDINFIFESRKLVQSKN